MRFVTHLTTLAVAFLGFSLIVEVRASVDLSSQFDELKAHLLPEEYDASQFSLDDARRLLQKKCYKNGAKEPQVLDRIEAAAANFLQCAAEIANVTVLIEEVKVARPTGKLDEVFGKYCQRQPKAESCLNEFNEAFLPCLNPLEKAQNTIMLRIIYSLLDFICYHNGDHIAMFIAEEGPECFEANKENMSNCMNATFSAYLPKSPQDLSELTDLPELVFGARQCIDLNTFEACILGYLEQCNEVTPANIIESMFRYVKNETKCQAELEQSVGKKQILKQPLERNRGTSHRSAYHLIVGLGFLGGMLNHLNPARGLLF